MTLIRVLIIDLHPIHREGLRAIIGSQHDMVVAADAASGAEGLALAREHRPDVALLDLHLPDADGVDIIRGLGTTRAVVLTSFEGDEDIYRAIRAGARAYLLKSVGAEELLGTIRDVHAGERRLPPALAARLMDRAHGHALTRREMEVLQQIVQGRRNRHIARALAISEGTVKGHVKSILGKLRVADRTQAATEALRRGIVHL